MKTLLIERNRYYDSVFLMRISQQLEGLPDVSQATVAMGTPANREALARIGFSPLASDRPPTAMDLIIAIDADTEETLSRAREQLEILLKGDDAPTDGRIERPTTLHEAVTRDPEANLALVSVPGRYAAREARLALRHGLHVMLFSDNVDIQDEITLKDEAIHRGLLMMGPDCGTAILNGAPLGFANAVRRGKIGIVGASGTGIQEISSLIHRLGGGISQAIGTGGRDLSAKVAGRMTRFAIRALAANPATGVIVVVSKTPAPDVADRVIDTLAATGRPAILHFVGARETPESTAKILFTDTLAETAVLACRLTGRSVPLEPPDFEAERLRAAPGQRLVHGFFCGGTLCQEAWSILAGGGLAVHSNVSADPAWRIRPETAAPGHVLWDLGDDIFTVGRPHPMIEPRLRDDRVAAAGNDPRVAIVLADCVIGYGAHDDPAGSLAEAARRSIEAARAAGRDLAVIASVTGTDADPQGYARQRDCLIDAGVWVAPSNAAASRAALATASRLAGDIL